MILILPSQALVLNAYAVLIGSTPGSTAFSAHTTYIAGATQFSGLTGSAGAAAGAAAYKSALNDLFASQTTAALATTMLANLGLSTAFTQAQAEAFLTANASNRVGAMIDLASQLYIYSGTDAGLKGARAAYEAKVDGSYAYSAVAANTTTALLPGTGPAQTFTLTTSVEKLMGTAFDDIFLARSFNNQNTLNDADRVDGGAGNDTIYVDFFSVGTAITPVLTSIETFVIRAQNAGADANGVTGSSASTGAGNGSTTNDGNNMVEARTVQIDAQRSLAVNAADKVTADVGVMRWEDNNSRSDVVIEDVRIGNTNKTKDVTIAMVETDPGNVDFGVYFDQLSLRNAGGGTSVLTIQIMDTGAAAQTATAATPLLNNPYDTFKIGINGVLQTINLNTTAAPATAANADTYAQLLAAFQAALLAGGGNATAALGADFTVTDPLTGKPVTGKSIVLTGASGIAFSDSIAGAGWVNSTGAAVPNSSNIYTTFKTDKTDVVELVTSKVILDDVGRGSTGGDLVIGGLSVGTTSTSRGVERFEITVNDNSRLQTINGTNNALREVTIVSGTTDSTVANAYRTTTTNEGDLAVNGTNFVRWNGAADNMNVDANLDGVNTMASAFSFVNGGFVTNVGGAALATALAHSGTGAAGFTDVRLIDASAFKGKLAFTAAISSDSIVKYLNPNDVQANPVSDIANVGGNINFNVRGANFIYTGGNDDDSMEIAIDSVVASSRSVVVSGMNDFSFVMNGGEGNDAITVTVMNNALAGGAQAWYNNQKLNANIAINAGDGNDTVRTPGAGDVIIDLGAGNDTVYTDNTGVFTTAVATGTAGTAALAYANAATAELGAALAVVLAANATDAAATAVQTSGLGAGLAAQSAALDILDALTSNASAADVAGAAAVVTAPVAGAITAATQAAYLAGGITATEKVAIDVAYNAVASSAITPAVSLGALATFTPVAPTGAVNIAAGDAAVAAIVARVEASLATALATDTNAVTSRALLNTTQTAVVNANLAVNATFASPATPASATATAAAAGLATTLATANTNVTNVTANLATLTAALATGATDGAVTTATTNALAVNAITAAQKTAIDAIANNVPATVSTSGEATAMQALYSAATGAAAAAAAQVTAAGAVTTNTATINGGAAIAVGSAVRLAGLTTLQNALVLNATDAAVVATINSLLVTGAITAGDVNTVITVPVVTLNGAAVLSAGELAALTAPLAVLINTANNTNVTNLATLANAVAADTAAINTASTIVGTTAGVDAGNLSAVAGDAVGSTEAAAAAAAAAGAATAAANNLATQNAKTAGLIALKGAISTTSTQFGVVNLLNNAENAGFITTAQNGVLVATGPYTAVTTLVTGQQKLDIDSGPVSITTVTGKPAAGTLDALIETSTEAAAVLAVTVTNTAKIAVDTGLASTIAAAAAASQPTSYAVPSTKAVYVFNTLNQNNAAYVNAQFDDRNVADLRSDANNSNNFFNTTVKVIYKGIEASVVVVGTGNKTTDLEINQAIKQAILTDAVLSKLLVASDGPANSLVVTSLIDGAHVVGNLAITVTLPTTVGVDLVAAAAAYGLAAGSTEAQVLAAMATAKTAFDTKGDYTTKFAESGANAGNANLVGGNSTSSSDNTVTPGTGNDVIVLGTTATIDTMSSSNEQVIYSGTFGSDTIVNFAAAGIGADSLNLSALNGRGSAFGSLSADKSIVVGAATAAGATVLTAVQIAALFTDSATAIGHVYVAVDFTNIGSIWQVADAAGTAAGNVTATLVGSIDLADTAWSTLTAANFV